MDSSFVVVAKTVMENRQMLAALTYALSVSNPELFAVYEEKLAEIKKTHERDFMLMDSVLQKLNEKDKEE
ncbi:hypothetical protein [Polluticoccus soli]|uniref:hypothetical protein n=1 Tax=Polluticoccus soli TaxID=3034150 RepID=UPI0023E10D7D|nr:hypothetical protein [Flavipsychrobacter sp. JY13-12]